MILSVEIVILVVSRVEDAQETRLESLLLSILFAGDVKDLSMLVDL